MKSTEGGYIQWNYNDHPFIQYYIVGWLMRWLGGTQLSEQLFPSLCSLGSIFVTMELGTLMFGGIQGVVAGLILGTSLQFIYYSQTFNLDPALILFILLSSLFWWKRNWLWLGVTSAAGVWVKGPVAFMIFPSAALSLYLAGQPKKEDLILIKRGFLIALFLAPWVWIFEGAVGGWSILNDYWNNQFVRIAIKGMGESHSFDFSTFFLSISTYYWPWLPILVGSLGIIWKKKSWKTPAVSLCLSSAVVVIFTISALRSRYSYYFLPAYPFFALLCAQTLGKWSEKYEIQLCKWISFFGMIIPVLTGFVHFMDNSAEAIQFKSVESFSGIIQSFGTCQDHIALVDSQDEYYNQISVAKLQSFTNRSVSRTPCSQVNDLLKSKKINWIVMESSQIDRCLNHGSLTEFSFRKESNGHSLLSKIIPKEKVNDVSGLDLAGKWALYCANPGG